MSGSREEILDGIRSALGKRVSSRGAEYERIPREYTVAQASSDAEVLELLEDRLHDYDAATHRCGPAELPVTIARCLASRGRSQILLAEDFPAEWLPEDSRFIRDRKLGFGAIDQADGLITTCSVAIALTGTIVLQEGAFGQGRRVLSLLPDYHLCVVHARQVVHTVPEGIRAIESTASLATTTNLGSVRHGRYRDDPHPGRARSTHAGGNYCDGGRSSVAFSIAEVKSRTTRARTHDPKAERPR